MLTVQLKFKTSNRLFLFQTVYVFIYFLKIFSKSFQLFFLPSKKKVITVLNSPHVNRTSQKQFCILFYRAILVFRVKKKSNFQNFLFLLLTNSGVSFDLKVLS